MKRSSGFADFLVNPPGDWNGIVALLGFGLLGSLLNDLLPLSTAWQRIILSLSLVALLWGIYAVWRRKKPKVLVPQEQQPEKHPGLILLIGTGRPGEDALDQSALDAIDYHQDVSGGNGLKVCWLIASGGETGSLPIAQKVEAMLKTRNIKGIIRVVRDAFDVQDTYNVVRKIYQEELEKEGLSRDQVIADFTGGVKPMTVGMILACGDHQKMQYMYGRKKGVASIPRLVEFHY